MKKYELVYTKEQIDQINEEFHFNIFGKYTNGYLSKLTGIEASNMCKIRNRKRVPIKKVGIFAKALDIMPGEIRIELAEGLKLSECLIKEV